MVFKTLVCTETVTLLFNADSHSTQRFWTQLGKGGLYRAGTKIWYLFNSSFAYLQIELQGFVVPIYLTNDYNFRGTLFRDMCVPSTLSLSFSSLKCFLPSKKLTGKHFERQRGVVISVFGNMQVRWFFF